MTIGVGSSDAATELANLNNMVGDVQPVCSNEFNARISKAQQLMKANNIMRLMSMLVLTCIISQGLNGMQANVWWAQSFQKKAKFNILPPILK